MGVDFGGCAIVLGVKVTVLLALLVRSGRQSVRGKWVEIEVIFLDDRLLAGVEVAQGSCFSPVESHDNLAGFS